MPNNYVFPFSLKPSDSENPFPIFRFWVEIEGIVGAQFQDCSGLRLERTVEMIEEGGVNDYVTILPGRNKYGNIVLKKGISEDNALWDWYLVGLDTGKVTRKNFSILLMDSEGNTVRRWNVISGFPVKWEGPQLQTDSTQIAIETLEIAHHGIKMG